MPKKPLQRKPRADLIDANQLQEVQNQPFLEAVTLGGKTLSEQRLDKYGIGGAPPLTTSRTRQKKVDYLRLNDGLEETTECVKSPTAKRRRTHLPSRSGPSTGRQRAQKTVTSPPAQVLAITPAHSKQRDSPNSQSRNTEVSGVQLPGTNSIPQNNGQNLDEISGVHMQDNGVHSEAGINSVSGVQTISTISGVHMQDNGVHSEAGIHSVSDVQTTSAISNVHNMTLPQSTEDGSAQTTGEQTIEATETLPDLVVN